MKRFLTLGLALLAHPAQAFDTTEMIAQCEAPIAKVVAKISDSDARSTEWSNLNLAVLAYRRSCAVPLALRCHLSDAPDSCFAELTAAFDAKAEAERGKLVAYKAANGVLFGDLGAALARTDEARARERQGYCAQQTTDAATYVRAVGGNADAACHLEVAVGQWATLAWSGAAPRALSLLPPMPPKE